ncbi:RraA family protein [Aurantimonas sp. VKM B-3413]|uniref:RraA family protein n=1 Tax=Aurantimonas sp. VKM B-3413 TaxID=2779401 RepID=UPI001E57BF48|nr:RraA family protein [Aurantimonas sp. VKM B-3413]MCB8839469.1 RraA family protein [Aurantimonas sp. VKM B-3413]
MTDRSEIAKRLKDIPTTLAADILKDEALFERSVSGLAPMTAGSGRFAGTVRTIAFLPGRPELRGRAGPPLNFSAIDALEPGEVLVLAAGGSMRGAILGDMLATRAHERGAAGAVVDGAVRDLAGMEEARLPVFARGVAPMAAHATLVPVAVNTQVRFGDVAVLPDDWVLADEDGVLVLPLSLVERLIERHAAASVKERFSRQLLLAGFALAEVFPLPAALEPFLKDFAKTERVPTAETVRQAIGDRSPARHPK